MYKLCSNNIQITYRIYIPLSAIATSFSYNLCNREKWGEVYAKVNNSLLKRIYGRINEKSEELCESETFVKKESLK